MPGAGKCVCEHLVRYYALELAKRKITVNAVVPGYVKTEAWARSAQSYGLSGTDDPKLLAMVGKTPMARWATPDEVGKVVAWLASPAAAFISGVALPVDGGLHLT